MNEHARDLFAGATKAPDQLDGAGCQSVGVSVEMRDLFRRVWPKKTAAYLAIEADVTVRQAERILSGKQGIGGEVQANLLRSEIGAEVLEILMNGFMPQWWKEAFHEKRITAARKRRLQAERELRELENSA